MTPPPDFQLQLRTPFAVLGLQCDEHAILRVAYLPNSAADIPPQNALAAAFARVVRRYLKNPKRADFDFPLYDAATPHQQKVRRAVRDIPPGETASYGDIARAAKTSPRAVGGACRANALPLIVPCHRVVAANNNIGGFMGDNQTNCVDIKRQLLAHEGVRL